MNKKMLFSAAFLAALAFTANAEKAAPCFSLVGDYGVAGACSYNEDTDTYTINGCGADIWGSADAFTYVYAITDKSADFDYLAKFESFSTTEDASYTKAGIMVRECGWEEEFDDDGNPISYSQDAGARYFYIQSLSSSGSSLTQWVAAWRPELNLSVSDEYCARYGAYSYPSWQRLRRIGDTIYSYVSTDGASWTLVGYQDTSNEDKGYVTAGNTPWSSPMGEEGENLAIGLAVTSHDASNNAAVAVISGFQKFVQTPVTFVTAPKDIELTAGTVYTLSTKLAGYNPFSYTLKKGKTTIAEGTTMDYVLNIDMGTIAESGTYTLEVANTVDGAKKTVSKSFKIDVIGDIVPPSVTAIRALGKEIGITFSEAVTDVATKTSAYTVAGNTVASVAQKSATNFVLTLNKAISGDTEVTFNGIKDFSGNEFSGKATAIAYTLSNSGKASTPGTASLNGGDTITINNWGMDYWYNYGEDTFVYREMTGDFDIQARLTDMPLGAKYSRGGISARVNLDEGTTSGHGAFVAINQFPMTYILWDDETASFGDPVDNIQSFSDYRQAVQLNWRPSTTESTTGDGVVFEANFDGVTASFGNNPGKTFVRLVRIGNTFYGYYSTDNGETWTLKNSYTIKDAPAKMYVGQHFAVEGYQFDTNTPDSLKEWMKNPDLTFSASWTSYNEGYCEAVAFTSQPESQSLQANAALTLKVTAIGDPLQYQWYKDGIALEESAAIQGTKTATLYLPYTAASDSGSYTCRIFNLAGDMPTSEAISDVALVSITAETEAPELVAYGYDFNTKTVYAQFSEGMDMASLLNKANYTITDKDGKSVAITGITVSKNATYVSIAASGLIQGENYTFAFSGLKDRSLNPLPDAEPVEFAVTYSQTATGLWYSQTIRGGDIYEFRDIVRNNSVSPSLISTLDLSGYSTFNYPAATSTDYFSVAIMGYILPPETGNYIFATSSDDQSLFYLSSDSTVAGLPADPTCYQGDYNGSLVYTKSTSTQQSKEIYLEAGKYYYFEYYFWEASGDELFSLAWSLPSQGPTQIADGTDGIPMEYVRWVINPSHTVLEITDQPTKVAALDQNSYTIPVTVNYSSDLGRTVPTYTWYIKNGNTGNEWQAVADYNESFTAGFSDYDRTTLKCAKIYAGIQDGTFRLKASLAGKEIYSQDIVVEVQTDTESPIGYPKGSNTMEEVIISFSEPVFGADSEYAYEIPGLDITGISVKYSEQEGDIELVALYTNRQEEGKVYTVKFNGITDAFGNEIVPTAKFTAFVWASGYSVLECFDQANGYDDLYETIYWNAAASAYRVGALNQSPLLGDALEIHSTTFNQDYCVERITGYITPKESGNYTFTGSVDDRYKMWISADESVSNIDPEAVISYETAWNSSGERQWDWSGCTGECGATPVYLEAGKKYYYVASLQEDGGGDFLTITWTKEGNAIQSNGTAPILRGDLIGCYVNPDSATITFTTQPQSVAAKAGETITLTAEATTVNDYSQKVTYQWYAGDNAISGATGNSVSIVVGADLIDVPIFCRASVPGKSENSEFAYIDVELDEVAATPTFVSGSGETIVVVFDKPILAASAAEIAHYSVVGATVKAAELHAADTTDCSVELTVEGCSGNVITVAISGVESKSGIAMPETVTLQGGYLPLTQVNICAEGKTSGVGALGQPGYGIVYPDYTKIYASGYDVDGAGDACLFMYEEVEGDFDIVIRAEENNADNYQWSKVGLMFRASLSYDSPQINVLANYNSTYNTQRRFTTGGGTDNSWPQLQSDGSLALVGSQNTGDVFYPNNWIRLKREGTRFYAYRATSDEEPNAWTLMTYGDFNGTVEGTDCTLPLKGYVGIFATSHNVAVVGEYKVSGINLNYVYAPKSDETEFAGQDILKNGEQPGQPGAFTYNAETGVYNITGSGADLRSTSDGCYYVSQPVPEGDFQIVAKLLNNTGSTTTWIKSGLMVREADANGNLNGDARLFGTHTQRADQTGGSCGSPWTVWRNALGATIDDSTGGYYEYYPTTYPLWHRITKFGSIYTGWISYAEEPEESDWLLLEEVDTAEWADGALGSTLPLYVGMWVTANSSSSNDAHAKFADVAISEYVGLSHDETDFLGQDILKNGEQPARNGRFYYNEETDTFVIIGSGNDVRPSSDGCYYVYQPVPEGNFQIVAQLVKTVGSTTSWIKSGLMFREGDADGNLIGNARIFGTHTQRFDQTSGSNGSPWTLWRNALSASITDETGGYYADYPTQYPNWQRLTKVGSVVTGWISYAEQPSEADWILLEEVDTAEWADGALGSTLPLYVGMFVTANSTSSNNARGEFANVSISEYTPAPVGDIALAYEFTGETIILKWAVSAQASLEVAPTATGEWTILNPEEIQIVDGVCTYEFPVSDENSFFRLVR